MAAQIADDSNTHGMKTLYGTFNIPERAEITILIPGMWRPMMIVHGPQRLK
jgi:hypothetical protein